MRFNNAQLKQIKADIETPPPARREMSPPESEKESELEREGEKESGKERDTQREDSVVVELYPKT